MQYPSCSLDPGEWCSFAHWGGTSEQFSKTRTTVFYKKEYKIKNKKNVSQSEKMSRLCIYGTQFEPIATSKKLIKQNQIVLSVHKS